MAIESIIRCYFLRQSTHTIGMLWSSNKFKFFACVFVLILVNNNLTLAHDGLENMNDRARSFLQDIFHDNAKHVNKHKDGTLRAIQTGQIPRATVVSCSDSRVQSSTIDDTPINDLFFIRNIGNQLENAKGSVMYGVQYLHTPVLLIMGHVDCGAIKAAIGNYKQMPQELRKELYTFDFPSGISEKDGVVYNIHNQVGTALEMFASEVKDNKLVVVGAVYDFQNEYKQGYNRLIVVNLNGEKDPQKIKESPYLQGINDLKIGTLVHK